MQVRLTRNWLKYGALLTTAFACSSCASGYLLRAAYEESKILLRREPIAELIENDSTDQETKEKLRLVLEARDFARELGLNPRESFTKFTAVDRDVLVWVLSASEKDSFTPVTWWFPIVGRIPYKGYFEKEDGLRAADELKANDYDTALRGSPAFSTLGWFNDPLLSTTLRADPVSLVNTVIHETLHSTIWVPNHVAFNESFANFVGHVGAIEFFRIKYPGTNWELQAVNDWHDELLYAEFLSDSYKQLQALYDRGRQDAMAKTDILVERDKIFTEIHTRWGKLREKMKSPARQQAQLNLNNAVIIGQRLYLDRLEIFSAFYKKFDGSLSAVLAQVKQMKFEGDPYADVEEFLFKTY